MDFLTSFFKYFGLAILGVLLCLSLSFFGLVLTIDQTIFNPEFAVSQIDKLDIASLGEEIITGQILPEATVLIPSPIKQLIVGALNDTIADLEPWLKQQAREVTYATYDYLEGRSQHISVVISLEPAKESLRENILESPLPELAGYSPELVERYLDTFYQQVPPTFEFDEAWLGPENMAQLEQAKQFISYFQAVFYALIGFILLLILGIVLIHRQVRGSTRSLGTIFLSGGILSYVGFLLAKEVIGAKLAQAPVYLQTWLPQLLADTLAPMQIYSLGLAGVGIVLLIVSFVYKRGEASF